MSTDGASFHLISSVILIPISLYSEFPSWKTSGQRAIFNEIMWHQAYTKPALQLWWNIFICLCSLHLCLCLPVWMVYVWIWRIWLFLFNQHKYYSTTIFILSLLYVFTFSSLKNWFFQTVVLEMTLESPLDSKEIKPVNPKGNQPWIFIGRTDAEAEAPILWSRDVKTQFIGKDPDAGKDWWEKEKRGQRMRCLAHRLIRHEFEQTLGDSGGQRSLVSMGSQRVGPNLETEQQQYLR